MFEYFDIFECYDINALYSLQGKPDIQISFLLALHAKGLKTEPKQDLKIFSHQFLENCPVARIISPGYQGF